ncbi:helix-turn-helix domain-containing protein [Staphylococcus americanisciuri]|uniref:AraC family transcriptional regulator n=1 Tax=Staphylococcus americanisciuri TaxID=2973940 RepID=A0ABT2F430_9STAP|nr:AraC family transcriptional regulator [Staphylococcus americanisciuri]MCS4486567.1 AraC family transcriptional regulator [Staphylococcus americanisciuri]
MYHQETFNMLKAHAIELLMLEINAYDLSDIKGISQQLKSPFTNTKRKKYQKELTHLLASMDNHHIYHYTNQFDVNFLMFKYRKINQIIILGPFLQRRPREQQCQEMLQRVQIKLSRLYTLKQYLLQVPVCPYSQALKMTRLAMRYLKNKYRYEEVLTVDFNFHEMPESYAEHKEQYDYTLAQIQQRYNLENRMLTAIENGNVEEALALHTQIMVSVAGIQRARDTLLNQKYKVYLINSLSRKAIERAHVNLLTVDQLSKKFATQIDEANSVEDLEQIAKNLIYEYTATVIKAKSLHYSPKISKVVQYIEMNLDRPITLKELAENVELAPAYLSRLFNKETGQSVSQYMMSLRLKKGKNLLETTSMSIEDIASYVGFQQQSYFAKCFRDYFGQTPLQYRKQYHVKV